MPIEVFQMDQFDSNHAALYQDSQDREIYGDSNDDYDERYYYPPSNSSSYDQKNVEGRTESSLGREKGMEHNPNESAPPIDGPNPDRAISIVSELKANAALFAAFAYGSLNLPNTLTVSESKVTSVTTSLSVSRPLPDSDLIRAFVVLDVSTLCLMISCVAASQLLIYRLTDGSYEDIDETYGVSNNSLTNPLDNYIGSKRRKNSRESALGRLVTTYRNEFTVARITFDLGLVTLLFSVGVRSLAIFDEDIVLPIAFIITITAFFLAVAYVTTYVEVFRTEKNLTQRPFFSFLTGSKQSDTDDIENDADLNLDNPLVSQIFLPISLISVGLGLYFTVLGSGSEMSGSNLSRLGPYDVTSGATKLKVVTEKIDSEKGKFDTKGKGQQRNSDTVRSLNSKKKTRSKAASERAEAEAARKKAAEIEAKKKFEEEAKKKADDEAKKKAEEEAKKKAEEEAKKKEEEMTRRLETIARRKAEEEADAISAAAAARVEGML
eukprot:CAMPEP_0197200246 /NCGR_PEP_ID=MMETSP1423-20130617/34291_1 /TAXON_ID=476441 /ORGANISM="Pseudo-nitzschia heimii, Strain UNC1101" /LENGTH=493 /DNA_ID=CAMNT_0042654121 /DNA_START=183 /DNA_END=1665 /DNA_ORIENTATION=-